MFAQLLGYRFGELPDGRRLIVRPVGPDDKALLQWGVEHLSPESAYRRFFSPKPRLTAAELRYFTEIDHRDHEALVAVLADDPATPVGVARFVRLADDPCAAEAAITIGDPFQGQGVGRLLLRLLADAARDRGIGRFTATMLSDNVGARRLFSSISTRVDATANGSTVELVCHLGPQRELPRGEVPDLLAA